MKKNVLGLLLVAFLMVSLFAEIQVGTGSVTGKALPIEPYYGYSYSQNIYEQSEIMGGGTITSLKYQTTSPSGFGPDAIKIYMAHTDEVVFSTGSSWIPINQFTEVFSGYLNVPSGQNTLEFTLSVPFEYNNVDNLVIAWEENTGGYHGGSDEFYCTNTATAKGIYYYSDSTNPNPVNPPTGILQNAIANVALVGIDVSLEPIATITVSDTLSYLNQQITFTSVNHGGIATAWEWDVNGDDIVDYITEEFQHSYGTVGRYSVSLTVTNEHGTNSITHTDYIRVVESSDISVDPLEYNIALVQGDSLQEQLTITNSGGEELEWSLSGMDIYSVSDTYTFTNCGVSGRFGPNQNSLDSQYLGTSLEGLVTSDNGVQQWEVPVTGVYTIAAYGAKGGIGNNDSNYRDGGKGAKMQGDIELTAGTILNIVVGQKGANGGSSEPGGGGGGSFVYSGAIGTGTLFIAAGGGGGGCEEDGTSPNGKPGVISEQGTKYNGTLYGTAGQGGTNLGTGGAGAGWLSDGTGLYGGTRWTGANVTNGDGGFGGGGGAKASDGGGCGAGYSGGSSHTTKSGGGGGGSYNSGINQVNEAGIRDNDGLVVISISRQHNFADNYSGVIPPNSQETVNFNFVSEGFMGVYNENIIIDSNDPDEPIITIPVELAVGIVPISAFTYTDTVAIGVLTVDFTYVETGGTATAWEWDINSDGVVDYTTQDCQHTYTTSGLHTVTLTVSNDFGTDEMIKTDLINILEPSVISVNPTEYDISLVQGDSLAQELVISNEGGGELEWSLSGMDIYSTSNTFTFTNCGTSGFSGPTQNSVDSEYIDTSLDGLVTSDNGVQQWEVPYTGTYTITTYGAKGGIGDNDSYYRNGGNGAKMQGDIELTAGTILNIVVGQKGGNGGSSEPGGGGGGSFVYSGAIGTGTLYIAAGGGGGGCEESGTSPNGKPGVISEQGTKYNGTLYGTVGEGGINLGKGGAGAGWLSNGSGYYGGTRWTGANVSYGDGGFGGGGGATASEGGGCGAGYSGGSSHSSKSGGGGGGSYNSGTNQVNEAGVRDTNGLVVITYSQTQNFADNYSGVVAPYSQQTVNLNFKSDELLGLYNENIYINSNDPNTPTTTIPVELAVGIVPIAEFTYSDTVAVGELTVDFTYVETAGETTAWEWDIDNDGVVDYTTENCQHTYSNTGIYTVSLKVINDFGDDTLIRSDLIRVNEPAEIGAYPLSYNIHIPEGDSLTESLNLYNYGLGELEWSIGTTSSTSGGESYLFTNCGQTGRTGPTQSSINSSYLGSSLEGQVTSNNGIQQWTVPTTGYYHVETIGAKGGSTSSYSGGLGAKMEGTFFFEAGEIVNILVGQMGIGSSSGACGGGGASFVVSSDNTPLIIAGGGSGTGGSSFNGANASTEENGLAGSGSNIGAPGGVDGNGGAAATSTYGNGAGGAGGFLTDGANNSSYGSQRGYGYLNGGYGGVSSSGSRNGGFGGGAGTHSGNTGGGAGGGYSGGGAAYHSGSCVGGGGGSFNSGTEQSEELGIGTSHGSVTITLEESSSYAIPGSGLIAPSGEATVAIVFNAITLQAGVYEDSVIVYSNDPAQPELNIPVTINVGLPPVADFTESITTGYDPLVVDFNFVDIEQDVTSWEWDIDSDGTVDYTTEDCSHTYLNAGTYSVELTVTNQYGTDTLTKTDLIVVTGNAPEISLSQQSFNVNVPAGDSLQSTLTISNVGLSDLTWSSSTEEVRFTPLVSSRTSKSVKESARTISRTTEELEEIKLNLNENYETINSLIPNRYDFTNGTSSNYIADGGGDMYDNGNYISTNFGSNINYTNGVVQNHAAFGNADYFTAKYPGLFILVADLNNISYFQTSGGTGADGSGYTNTSIVEATVAGTDYTGYVKRIYGAGDPSINHIIITKTDASVTHQGSTDTDSDYHRVSGVENRDRIYYLLFATSNASNVSDAYMTLIMHEFLQQTVTEHPMLAYSPENGTIPAQSDQEMLITFHAEDLDAGTYTETLTINSNDPNQPSIDIPLTLNVSSQSPIAEFTLSDTLGVNPLEVTFTDDSTGGPASWEWDIDNDGIVDYTTQNCTHTYTTAGTYSVKLTVLNMYGTDTMIKTDRVVVENSAPVVLNPIDDFDFDEDITNSDLDLNNVFFDEDNDELNFTYSEDNHLNISIADGIVTIIPEENWFGTETITFTASEQSRSAITSINRLSKSVRDRSSNLTVANVNSSLNRASVDESVTITVNPINDAPQIITPMGNIAFENNSSFTTVTLNDIFADVESANLNYVIENETHLSTVINEDKTVTITPDADWNGSETLFINASDDEGLTVTDYVNITILESYQIQADFNNGGNIPEGWTVQHLGDTTSGWHIEHQSGDDYDWLVSCGFLQNANERLISPVYDFTDYASLELSFYTELVPNNSYTANIEYSTNGVTWDILASLTEAISGTLVYDISEFADETSSVQFRWVYQTSDFNTNSWRIDNFAISGVVLDNTVPTEITDFALVAYDLSSATLNWSAIVDENFQNYEIYYSTDELITTEDSLWSVAQDGALAEIETVSTTITDLTANIQYWFAIRGVDSFDNYGNFSNIVTIIPSIEPVASNPFPTQIDHQLFNSRTVEIGMTFVDDGFVDATSIQYRIDANGDGLYNQEEIWNDVTLTRISRYADEATVVVRENVTFSVDSDTLRFEFRAHDTVGIDYCYSGSSNVEGIEDDYFVRVDTVDPTQITDLYVNGVTASSIALAWSSTIEEHFSHYEIFYSTNETVTENDNLWSVVNDASLGNINTNTISVAGLDLTETNYFVIRAVDEAGLVSLLSNVVVSIAHSTEATCLNPIPVIQPNTLLHNSLTVDIGCTFIDYYGIDTSTIQYRFDANGDGTYDGDEWVNYAQARTIKSRNSRSENDTVNVLQQVTYETEGENLKFEFRAWDIDGFGPVYSGSSSNEGIADDWNVSLDITAPADITVIATTGPTETTMSIGWYVSSDAHFSHYELFYSTSADVDTTSNLWDFNDDAGLAVAGVSFIMTTIPNLEQGTTYYFRARAVDMAGNYSALTYTTEGTTLGSSAAPIAPENITIQVTGADVILNWTPVTLDVEGNSINISSYNIYWSSNPNVPTDVNDAVTQTNSFTHVGGGTISQIFYKIVAVSGGAATTSTDMETLLERGRINKTK